MTETKTEATDPKPKKPMSEEQKEKIRQAMKKYQRSKRAGGTPTSPAKKAKKVAKKSAANLKAVAQISPNPVHDGLWRLVTAHGLPAVSRGLAEIKAGLERLARGE